MLFSFNFSDIIIFPTVNIIYRGYKKLGQTGILHFQNSNHPKQNCVVIIKVGSKHRKKFETWDPVYQKSGPKFC